MTNENLINKDLIESFPGKLLYYNSTIVNEDFGRFIKNLFNLKYHVETERIIHDHHRITPYTLATQNAFKPTRTTAHYQDPDSTCALLLAFSQHHPLTTNERIYKQQKNA
jgi:hypothetical protein